MSPRLSVGPEVVIIAGDDHKHLMLTGNVTWDFVGPRRASRRSTSGFVVLGGGLFQDSDRYRVSNVGGFTAGAGFRVPVRSRLSVGGEGRIANGHLRLGVTVEVLP
jgi:hypothetical protein